MHHCLWRIKVFNVIIADKVLISLELPVDNIPHLYMQQTSCRIEELLTFLLMTIQLVDLITIDVTY